jgi:imidazolonepropionase-like amidohydrolase
MCVHRRIIVVALSCAVLFGTSVRAQVNSGESIPDVTRTIALTNARVVQAPGQIQERANVIIRDGLITTIAPDAAIPFDALEIPADSFTVYAGFIDGLSHTGIPEPKEQPNRERPDNPAYPPDELAGIQPQQDVRNLLDPKDKRITAMREAGFTAAHVVPRGRMLPGVGAIILLAGDDANEMVYRGETALYAQLAGARRMYPGTDMAVLAKLRQLYREAARRQKIEQLYAEDPAGLERPQYDPVLYAMFPVLDGDRPVFFNTESVLDLHRVLAVQQELGFPMVLTGLTQSFDAVDKLKSANLPLLLTLELPKEPENSEQEQPSDSTEAAPTDAAAELPQIEAPNYDADFRVSSLADVAAEKENLETRREIAYKAHVGNAHVFESEGLTFGFSTGSAKPGELLGNVRKMVKEGLSEDTALAALTTTPAQILGLTSSMGTVEEGKLGNLVVTKGSIFDEKGEIRYVFVDGRKYEIEPPKKRSSGNTDTDVNPAGTWSLTISTPDGDIGGTLTIEGSGNDWSGSLSVEIEPGALSLEHIVLSGNELTFSFDAPDIGTVESSLILDSESLNGSFDVPGFGVATVSGTRTSDPGMSIQHHD